jgi:hypothetical protein
MRANPPFNLIVRSDYSIFGGFLDPASQLRARIFHCCRRPKISTKGDIAAKRIRWLPAWLGRKSRPKAASLPSTETSLTLR